MEDRKTRKKRDERGVLQIVEESQKIIETAREPHSVEQSRAEEKDAEEGGTQHSVKGSHAEEVKQTDEQ